MKYTIEQAEFRGATCFKVLDDAGKLMAMPDTIEDAEKEIRRLSGLPDFVATKDAFEFTSGMYGSDREYPQGAGNSEADEDRRMGL
jgi:hypothetical protein